jgi:hypothetical protein
MKRRYNAVTVKDPRTDGYSVVVHPTQEIVLTLTDPINLFQKGTKDDRWEVKVYSDYFYLAGEKELAGKRQYTFIQYYDMRPWTDVSNIYLGDIDINLAGNEVCENYSLCVFAKKNTNKQSRIITAVNPAVNRIKIDLDEILEVVFYHNEPTDKAEEVWCALYDMGKSGTGNGSQWFERLRQETLLLHESLPMRQDQDNLYFTIARDIAALPRNPHLPQDKQLPAISEHTVHRQHHFWFRVRPEDKEAVLKANRGEPMANIVFNSMSGTCSNLQLLISTRGTRGKPEVPDYDKDRYEGNFRGLVGRYYSPSAKLLVNPGKTESVELLPKQDGLMVELAPPSITWPYTDPKNRWTCEVEPVMTTDPSNNRMGIKRMDCTEIRERHINQQAVQRFFIRPQVREIPEGDIMLFLGVVNFTCKEPNLIGKRTINCWLVRERSEAEQIDAVTPDRYRDLHPLPSVRRREPNRVQVYKPDYTVPTLPYKPRVEKIKVQITEEADDGLVTSGCSLTSFKAIKLEKKKDFNVCKITKADCDDYYGGTQKKKGIMVSPASSGSVSQNARSTRRSPLFSGHVGHDAAADACVLVKDPADRTLLTLKPGQYAAIRFPVAFWGLETDFDYFWCVNPVQIKEQQFFVRDVRMVREGKKLYQEAIIQLCPGKNPRDVGTHFIGGIRAHNKYGYIYVLVQLEVTDPNYATCNPEYSKALKEMLDGYREVRERLKAKKEQQEPRGSICVLVRDPDSQHKEVTLGPDDTLKVVLSKRLVTYNGPMASQTQFLRWNLTGLPNWLDVREANENDKETTYILEVDKRVTLPIPDELEFRSGDEAKRLKVALESQRKLLSSCGS